MHGCMTICAVCGLPCALHRGTTLTARALSSQVNGSMRDAAPAVCRCRPAAGQPGGSHVEKTMMWQECEAVRTTVRSPTGRSTSTSTPSPSSTDAGPMPLSCSSFGDPNGPAALITSFVAVISRSCCPPGASVLMYCTPTARPPSTTTLDTVAAWIRRRLSAHAPPARITGERYAVHESTRRPAASMASALTHMPSRGGPAMEMGSATVGIPVAAAAVRYSWTYVCCRSSGSSRTCSLASVRSYSSPALSEFRPADPHACECMHAGPHACVPVVGLVHAALLPRDAVTPSGTLSAQVRVIP